jgi:hypothetical protein
VLKKGKYIPYEHPEQASQWEKEQKPRPPPMNVLFQTELRVLATSSSSFINPANLMQQAEARLLSNGGPSTPEVSSRLISNDGRKKKPVLKLLALLNNGNDKLSAATSCDFYFL